MAKPNKTKRAGSPVKIFSRSLPSGKSKSCSFHVNRSWMVPNEASLSEVGLTLGPLASSSLCSVLNSNLNFSWVNVKWSEIVCSWWIFELLCGCAASRKLEQFQSMVSPGFSGTWLLMMRLGLHGSSCRKSTNQSKLGRWLRSIHFVIVHLILMNSLFTSSSWAN